MADLEAVQCMYHSNILGPILNFPFLNSHTPLILLTEKEAVQCVYHSNILGLILIFPFLNNHTPILGPILSGPFN